MPTEGRWGIRALGGVIALMCLAGRAAAQHDALTGIDAGTEVRTITFDLDEFASWHGFAGVDGWPNTVPIE